jgi:hypothetical protein
MAAAGATGAGGSATDDRGGEAVRERPGAGLQISKPAKPADVKFANPKIC